MQSSRSMSLRLSFISSGSCHIKIDVRSALYALFIPIVKNGSTILMSRSRSEGAFPITKHGVPLRAPAICDNPRLLFLCNSSLRLFHQFLDGI